MLRSPTHHGGWIATGGPCVWNACCSSLWPDNAQETPKGRPRLVPRGAGFNLGSPFSFSNSGQKKRCFCPEYMGDGKTVGAAQNSWPRGGPHGEPPYRFRRLDRVPRQVCNMFNGWINP